MEYKINFFSHIQIEEINRKKLFDFLFALCEASFAVCEVAVLVMLFCLSR